MNRAEEILEFVAHYSRGRPERIDPDDILGSTGTAGDDAEDFFAAFGEKFGVDLSGLRPYLHYNANEPPYVRLAWGVGTDGRQIPDIPIGVGDLAAAAEAGHWTMVYPEHRLVDKGPSVLKVATGTLLVVAVAMFWPW